jgi:serine/threonine-protein kinase
MPDGKHIAYRSAQSSAGGSSIEWVRSDGSGVSQRLFESKNGLIPTSFSPDGRTLAYAEQTSETGFDIWTMQLDLTDPDHPKAGKPQVFLDTPSNELTPFFSPDGRWITYNSDESGAWETYVRSFPAGGGRWQISIGGSGFPIWSRTSRQLLYETFDNHIMVVDYVVADGSFVPGKPRLWANTQIRGLIGTPNFDLAPDGKRFAVFPAPEAPTQGGSVHMTFLLNFFDEVHRRVPAGK